MNIRWTTYPILFLRYSPPVWRWRCCFFSEDVLAQIISITVYSSNRYTSSSNCSCFKCTESSQVSCLLMVLSLTHAHTHTYKMLPFIDFHWCHVWLRITNGILHVINAWYSVIFTLTVCVYICTFRWLLDSLTLPLYPLNSQGDGDWFQCLAMWWFRCPRTVGVTQFTCDMHGCVVVFAMSQRFYCSSLFLHFKWFKCLLMLRSAKQTPILYLEKQVHIQSAWIKMLHLRQQHDSLQLAIIRYPARNESGRCWDVNSSTFDTG